MRSPGLAAWPARLERVAGGALIILALLLPFELKTPLVRLGPLSVTNVEAALYLALAVWGLQLAAGWPASLRWTRVHTAVLAWALALCASAVFAPVERGAALKFALRSLGGCALFFAAADLARTTGRVAAVMAALVLGGFISACAALAEVWLPGAAIALLAFKTQTTLIGSFVRAGGTFQYANIAAMYWEAALVLLIGLIAWGAARRSRSALGQWAGGAAVVLLIAALVLSASRAGLVVAGVVLAALLAVASRGLRALRAPAALGLVGLALLTLGGLGLNPWLALRLRSERQTAWYRADYNVSAPASAVEAGRVTTWNVTVRNDGWLTWPASGDGVILLSYHWRDAADGRTVIFDGRRTALPEDVPPGRQVMITAAVQAPSAPGRYVLEWDMVQENVLWFSAHGDDTGDIAVAVVPAPAGSPAPPQPPPVSLPVTQALPSRLDLWRAGWRMWLDHPLLGLGPDNFRHLYGGYLALERFDNRVHANSLYVETLATMGLAGVAALAGLFFALARTARRGWAALRDPAARALAAGLLAALAAFFLHGLADYFFEFTPTYGLFWLVAGAAAGLLGAAERGA